MGMGWKPGSFLTPRDVVGCNGGSAKEEKKCRLSSPHCIIASSYPSLSIDESMRGAALMRGGRTKLLTVDPQGGTEELNFRFRFVWW
jgi:hypothetical protein